MTVPNYRIIFAGTPEFSVASLRALVEAGITPVSVLTQPDRPAGRGKRLTASAVKRFAGDRGIPILQPKTLRDDDVAAQLAALEPDLIIVAAYGLILPQNVLDIPVHGCLNVHASLLPRWRGAAPIQASILAGDTETGVCLMSMTAGLDCGPVFACKAMLIGEQETAGELHDRLAVAGGALLTKHLAAILDGSLQATEQDEDLVTYAPRIVNSDAALDWQRPAGELARAVRAYNPVPGAWFMLGDERIKCWAAEAGVGVDAAPGTIVEGCRDVVTVACGDGVLRMLCLQRPGKRPVTAAEFAGQVDLAGVRL